MTAGDRALVTLTDVTMRYSVSVDRPASLKEYAVKRARRDLKREEVNALDGITLAVQQGEVFAVVGANGAGKSTLMKVIARVLPPTAGRVIVRGTLAPMIELGAGFNGELSGAENVVLYGALLGRDPDQMRARVGEIAHWAELDDAIWSPLRTYSTGMVARLGFAVATSTPPDLLVVDEILSVGDASFQKKSKARMRELIEQGTSVILVSHDLKTVGDLATRTLWLDHGRVRALGDSAEVLARYREGA